MGQRGKEQQWGKQKALLRRQPLTTRSRRAPRRSSRILRRSLPWSQMTPRPRPRPALSSRVNSARWERRARTYTRARRRPLSRGGPGGQTRVWPQPARLSAQRACVRVLVCNAAACPGPARGPRASISRRRQIFRTKGVTNVPEVRIPLSRAPSSARVRPAAHGGRDGFPPSSMGTARTPGTSPCPPIS